MFNLYEQETETKFDIIQKEDVILMYLTAVPGGFFSSTQLQKGMFLISKTIPMIFETNYEFIPESYGPVDKAVYEDFDKLKVLKMVTRFSTDNPHRVSYAATHNGFEYVQRYTIADNHKDYIKRVAKWILNLSFVELIKSINTAYPDYATNTIFIDV